MDDCLLDKSNNFSSVEFKLKSGCAKITGYKMSILHGIVATILLIIFASVIQAFQGSIPYGVGGLILAIITISSLLDSTKTATAGAMVVAFFTLLFASAIGDSQDVGFAIISLLIGLASMIGRRDNFL